MDEFKTKHQIAREKKENAIYGEYVQLTSVPGRSKMVILQYLCDKYGLASPSTIYAIRKRVLARIGANNSKKQ